MSLSYLLAALRRIYMFAANAIRGCLLGTRRPSLAAQPSACSPDPLSTRTAVSLQDDSPTESFIRVRQDILDVLDVSRVGGRIAVDTITAEHWLALHRSAP